MVSVSIDQEADVAAIDLLPGDVARSVEVGRSLLANYDESGRLLSVEVLSLNALKRPAVVDELRHLLGVERSPRPIARVLPAGHAHFVLDEPSPQDEDYIDMAVLSAHRSAWGTAGDLVESSA